MYVYIHWLLDWNIALHQNITSQITEGKVEKILRLEWKSQMLWKKQINEIKGVGTVKVNAPGGSSLYIYIYIHSLYSSPNWISFSIAVNVEAQEVQKHIRDIGRFNLSGFYWKIC